jgi:hypothetical protein
MNITSVHNGWPSNILRFDISLGNICNYKCYYCSPELNSGSDYWPDLELMKTNLTHLINYYKEHTNKNKFDFYFIGGEPTHWKKLPQLITWLKENFDCMINMSSNGSKDLEYWQMISPYFDRVTLSLHSEYVDIEHFRNVADVLYKNNTIVSVSTMMDPRPGEWEKCINYIDYMMKSKYRWTIRYVELIYPGLKYTPEQIAVMEKHKARSANIFWFLKNNKHYTSRVKVTDDAGVVHRLKDNEVLLKKLNNFYGWDCNLGVDWVTIPRSGEITGACKQMLFGESKHYNLYSENFVEEFQPKIQPTNCKSTFCHCMIETILPKQKNNFNKVIPIHAN